MNSGADIFYRDSVKGETPLHMAIRLCDSTNLTMIVCIMLDKININSNNKINNINIQTSKTGYFKIFSFF